MKLFLEPITTIINFRGFNERLPSLRTHFDAQNLPRSIDGYSSKALPCTALAAQFTDTDECADRLRSCVALANTSLTDVK